MVLWLISHDLIYIHLKIKLLEQKYIFSCHSKKYTLHIIVLIIKKKLIYQVVKNLMSKSTENMLYYLDFGVSIKKVPKFYFFSKLQQILPNQLVRRKNSKNSSFNQ